MSGPSLRSITSPILRGATVALRSRLTRPPPDSAARILACSAAFCASSASHSACESHGQYDRDRNGTASYETTNLQCCQIRRTLRTGARVRTRTRTRPLIPCRAIVCASPFGGSARGAGLGRLFIGGLCDRLVEGHYSLCLEDGWQKSFSWGWCKCRSTNLSDDIEM